MSHDLHLACRSVAVGASSPIAGAGAYPRFVTQAFPGAA
jgi:hypothetical protein